MIDNFAIGLTHVLMLVAAWRLLARPDLDGDLKPGETGAPPPWRRRKSGDA